MYHGIREQDVPAFREQLSFLARQFHVVPLRWLVDRLSQRAGPRTSEIALTFDDGLRNHLIVVYPILRELGLPATFFVCPGLVSTGRWFWNHEVRCRLESVSRERLRDLCGRLAVDCATPEEVVEWMKGLGLNQRLRVEEIIRLSVPEFEPAVAQKQACEIMSWDDLLSLDSRLITVGSHTLTHPILTTLDKDLAVFELAESRRRLEQELGRLVEYFCFPNGSHDARIHQAVRRIYRAAVTTQSGLVRNSDGLDLHLLPRIPSAESPALLAWRLHRPGA